jgi:hypothetical protein
LAEEFPNPHRLPLPIPGQNSAHLGLAPLISCLFPPRTCLELPKTGITEARTGLFLLRSGGDSLHPGMVLVRAGLKIEGATTDIPYREKCPMAAPTESYITEKLPDSTYATLLGVFAARCEQQQAELGLSPAELLEIQEAAASNREGLQNWLRVSGLARAAQILKQERQQAAKQVVSKYAKIFRANEAISDAVLSGLLLAPHNPARPKSPVNQVERLVATADGQGFVKLKWKPNGNQPRTQYLVEVRHGPSEPWTMLGLTTRTRFSHPALPGVYISFRVVAHRGERRGQASIPVTLWSDSPALRLAA